MHLDDEQVQRVLHGELADAAARAHVATCPVCAARIEAARREEAVVFGLLRRLDHAAPGVAAATVAARAQGRARQRLRWAAGVLLGLTLAGAAYAAPGSPLPAVVGRIAAWLRREPPPPVDSGAGIVVVPGARFTIVFASEHAAGTVTVSLIDGSSIIARRLNGTASFTSDVDRLTIAAGQGDSAAYEIELPRSAPWVEIRAGGRPLLLKDGERIETTPGAGAGGRYALPLGP